MAGEGSIRPPPPIPEAKSTSVTHHPLTEWGLTNRTKSSKQQQSNRSARRDHCQGTRRPNTSYRASPLYTGEIHSWTLRWLYYWLLDHISMLTYIIVFPSVSPLVSVKEKVKSRQYRSAVLIVSHVTDPMGPFRHSSCSLVHPLCLSS